MQARLIKVQLPEISVAVSDQVAFPLMVASHERSGTHFLMNSIAGCTHYVSNPWLNFDINPLGSVVNFTYPKNVQRFLASISRLDVGSSSPMCVASIVKSHYPPFALEAAVGSGLRVAYIYRNPVDVMVSMWRYLLKWPWFEGPKCSDPLMLAQMRPVGQSMRYQWEITETYFDRWAMHVSQWHRFSGSDTRVRLVRYSDLNDNHSSTITAITSDLSIDLIARPERPSKNANVIAGTQVNLDPGVRDELTSYCHERLAAYPDLPEGVMHA